MQTHVDSAMVILDNIDPSYLKVDSIQAKYHYLRAFGHMRQNRSMIGDSLIASAHNYYSGKDMIRDIRSATAYAWYKFWVGDTPGALDRDVRKPHENPSIGIPLCKDKDDEVVEYAMSRSLSPTLVAEYQLNLPPKKVLQAKIKELFEEKTNE